MFSWTKASAGLAAGAALSSLVLSIAIAATTAARRTAYQEVTETRGTARVFAIEGRFTIDSPSTLPNQMHGSRGDIMANAAMQVQVPESILLSPIWMRK